MSKKGMFYTNVNDYETKEDIMNDFIALRMYDTAKDKEIERLNNILDNIGYQIEGIIRTTENLGITKYTGEVISKHNIEILKNVIKMIETKDVSIGSDKE